MTLQKKIILLSFSLLSISYSWAQKSTESNPSTLKDSLNINFLSPNQISLTDSIVNYGKLFLNTPYHYGSTGTDTFDCSGFTSYVYRNFGYTLQRNSADQAQQFDTIDRSQLKTGDLVFFSGRGRSKRVGHVGIVVAAKENGEFDFIHSAVHSGVTISNSTESYYTKRFIKANRVIGFDPMLAVNQSIKTDNITVPEQPTIIPFSGKVQKSKKIIPAEYHRVKSGETLSSIAEKFGMTIAELKDKNDLRGSKINRNQKLLVREEETIMLVKAAKTEMADMGQTNNSTSTHTVKRGETLFSISKSLNLSIEDLRKLNKLKSGALSIGQELIISQIPEEAIQIKNDVAQTISKTNTHTVLKGESLFTLAKAYDISIEDLKKINNLKSGSIKVGQELKLSLAAEPNTEVNNTTAITEMKPNTHKVKNGENLSSISKKHNISIDDLKKFNKTVGRNIQIGQELKLSENNDIASTTIDKHKDISIKSINYKVKKGESLYTISKSQNISIDELKSINNLNSSQIKPGQTLKISIEKESNPTLTSKIKDEPKSITHKVSSGESYFSIAKNYSCSIEKLKEWNNKRNNKIIVGEKLIIHSAIFNKQQL